MKKLPNNIQTLFAHPAIRTLDGEHQPLYSAVDLLRVASGHPDPDELWRDMKRWEPALAQGCAFAQFPAGNGLVEEVEMLTLAQALRLLQSVHSPVAERVKQWLAEAGRQAMAEQEDPELAILRTRKLYEEQGYSPAWIEKRLRGINARHELTSQWYRRGLRDSGDFRTLTNQIMEGVFGMDVQAYRRYKGLTTENLRDQMNEVELALTVLGETAAAILHKQRNSHGIEDLRKDVHDAGRIAARTREAFEDQLGRRVPTDRNNLRPLFRRKRSRVVQE